MFSRFRFCPKASASIKKVAIWAVKALLDATHTSVPACVNNHACARRAIEDPGTFMIPNVYPHFSFTTFMDSRESAVSPDWLTKI